MTTYNIISLTFQGVGLVALVFAAINLLILVRQRKQELKDRRFRLYVENRESYLRYAEACRAFPKYDVSEMPRNVDRSAFTEEDIAIETSLITQWFSNVEAAYRLSHHTDKPKRSDHVNSAEWDDWLRRYLKRQHFLDFWSRYKGSYDTSFVRWMDRQIKAVETNESA